MILCTYNLIDLKFVFTSTLRAMLAMMDAWRSPFLSGTPEATMMESFTVST